MKKLIALILILLITPFLVTSEKSISEKAQKISEHNSKTPETVKWEYVKIRAFNENKVLYTGYNKPVIIILNDGTPAKDSLIVVDFIKKVKNLLPSIKIGLNNLDGERFPFHYVQLSFGTESQLHDYFEKRELEDGTIILKSYSGFVTTSDMSRHTLFEFKFKEDISDQNREMYINTELWQGVFGTKATQKGYSNQFDVQRFNNSDYNHSYGFLGDKDKFLLQKVYADDFKQQFEDYLCTYYPWQYAYSFLNKEKMKMLAISIVTAVGIIIFILLFSFFQNREFKHAYLNYLFPMVLIDFHIMNLTWIYDYLTELNSSITWGGSISFGFIFIGLLAIISATLLYFLEKMFIKMSFDFSFQLILKIVFTFIALHLPLFISLYLTGKNIALKDVEFLEFYFPWLIISIFLSLGRGLLIYLNHISNSLVNEKDVELSQLKEAHTQSELKLLQSHINPHFLYNALNSIAGLAKDDSDKTERMALSLSDLFRYSLNKKGEKMSTVAEEVALVENYLEIEKIRFGERLKFTLKVDETAEEEKIPMFMLQPLVENAIKHGVSKIGGEAKVSLNITKEKEGLLISVSDNGPGFPEGLVSGHGLQTVYDLLRLSYGKNASLRWENSPQKQILISIKKSNAHD
ncbi:Histidine kinase-, DNA gyrase B-, and HSP90-like ATPase [Salegentibacter echinorum]|uniref:Histidine kinase-, DNA gyrase B-, and HSP90-like ATPase n=1 Tax=Salegentibacter echinorum TaxID=1073325 RepID=A0A1M5KTG3_SALEC|nr:histidine kinase [Salegentibacter echinorum]SHG56047.1 Histidine kinase-, DNA gyrase B-, and HSP90-like ATPase [Salegentibacter echinorum]